MTDIGGDLIRLDEAEFGDLNRAIEQEFSEKGQELGEFSWYNLIPEDLKNHVAKLAHKNWLSFKENPRFSRFGNFSEEMAKNWVYKARAFPVLAEKFGMKSVASIHPEGYKYQSLAMLTCSASYVITEPYQPGANQRKILYARLPLRRDMEWVDQEGGVKIIEEGIFGKSPQVGRSTLFQNSQGGDQISTSPIILACAAVSEGYQDISVVMSDRVQKTFRNIDNATIF